MPRRTPAPALPPALRRRPLVLAVLLVALAAATPALARLAPGETIQISGIVTDPAGNPVGDVRVVLEASRSVFSLRSMRTVERDTTRVSAATDASGQFRLKWPWDRFYNHFELAIGVPIRNARGEELQILERVDVTRRLGRDASVVVPVTLEERDLSYLTSLRSFLATIDSPDEERVHQQLGKPDRVEIRDGAQSWWYFQRGRRYDFRDGRLVEVKSFDPVPET